jgi:hypothetical protein
MSESAREDLRLILWALQPLCHLRAGCILLGKCVSCEDFLARWRGFSTRFEYASYTPVEISERIFPPMDKLKKHGHYFFIWVLASPCLFSDFSSSYLSKSHGQLEISNASTCSLG